MIRLDCLAVAAIFAAGFACLRREHKIAGAALVGVAAAMLTGFLPWRAANVLNARLSGFHRWFVPRSAQIRRVLNALGALCGATAGISAFATAPGERLSDWYTPAETAKVDAELGRILRDKTGRERTLLGLTSSRRPVYLGAREREGHMQIVGPTRSGKSQLLLALAAQDMSARLPLFFMEAKGDKGDFDQFLKAAAESDRVDAVRYFNPQDARSMTFNPIRPIPGQDPTALANQIARAIGREPSSSGEGQDYYRAVDYAKIQNMSEVFARTGRAFSLRDCFYYFAFADAREEALKLCGDKRLIKLAREEFKSNPDSSGLISALRPWTTGTLGELLNCYSPQIKLEEIFERSQAAYFAVPIGHLQVLANPLGRMVISGLLSVAAARQRAEPKPEPATVILDEFAEFATPAFAGFIATVGSARLRTILSHQDLGQLRRVEGMDQDAFRSIVFNNTGGCKVCFRSPHPEDAEFWAATLGTRTTTADTERVEGAVFGERRTGDRSRRQVEQFKVHPNQLKSLESGTALVLSGRENCLVRTARVHRTFGGRPVPSLPAPPIEERGLDLRSAAQDYGDEAAMAAGGRA